MTLISALFERKLATFAEVALELQLAAWREAVGIEQLEIFAAKTESEAFKRSLADARRSAAILGGLCELFRSLEPHEAEVRAFLVSLSAPLPKPALPLSTAPQGGGFA